MSGKYPEPARDFLEFQHDSHPACLSESHGGGVVQIQSQIPSFTTNVQDTLGPPPSLLQAFFSL